MTAPKGVVDLVEKFERHRESYESGAYNETQLRREFLDPLFEALGWDVQNKQGVAEAYKDVIHEDAIKVGAFTKAPDYCFRIGGARKFFVEAKKPAKKLKDDAEASFQLRRYAWSAKLPLSILTDFRELAVYDCRLKPSPRDRASVGRVMYFTHTQYGEKWEEIAGIFARDAVLKGAFDKFAEGKRPRRGTAAVDDAFLKEIEGWREALAKNIAARQRKLDVREINFAVQKIIDRIIFLRICEDRGIEPYGRLQALQNGKNAYARLVELFEQADDRYNSGLFHFRDEKGRAEVPDRLTPQLKVDDDVLRSIIDDLYYPKSPYAFSVLSADILGQVYEQFLGKVIRLTAGHRVKVEEKPEVRKAGGVYYTPTHIVDYIVRETVGTLLEGKTPKQAAELKVLDPACGSGSFLIGAYQHLLDWHRDWYVKDGVEKHRKVLYQGFGGEWRLTTKERTRILLNNIYGVDIDPQAVEVTKLSLLLKVLEGGSPDVLQREFWATHERVLPDLGKNIKCGNTLIGPDFFSDEQLALLDEEARYQVNVFDWPSEFSEILSSENPGFDVIIGNPPYLNIDDTWGKQDPRLMYLKRAYPFVYNDKTDVLFYFLAKAVQLGRGDIAFIVSRAFLEAYKADKLRGWLASRAGIKRIIDFRNHYVFRQVGITTAIVNLTMKQRRGDAMIYRLNPGSLAPARLDLQLEDRTLFSLVRTKQSAFGSDAWSFSDPKTTAVIKKIDKAGVEVGRLLIVGQGMQTGRNGVFGGRTKAQIVEWGLKKGQYFERARNSDIDQFRITESGEYLLYLEDVKEFEDLPAGLRRFLLSNEKELKERAAFRRGDCDWWRYTWPLHKEHLTRDKLYAPYLAKFNRFALDAQQHVLGLTDTTVLYDSDQEEDLRYILGLLNSRLLTFRFRFIGKLKSGGILEYFWNSVSKLPIRRIDFSDPEEEASHERMTRLVDEAMSLRRKLGTQRTDHESVLIQRQIDAVGQQIDGVVYDLYGLTDEEIRIVEDATS